MSHSYLDFAHFDAAYRYSSTPSIAFVRVQPLTSAGPPILVQIRAPASRSMPLSLSKPSPGSIASRRQAQSDPTVSSHLEPKAEAVVAAERPISAILVRFATITWSGAADAESEAHPGAPAIVTRVEDIEAVSPKSKLPSVLQRLLQGTPTPNSRERERVIVVEPLKIGKGKRRKATSVVAVKSPYPRPQSEELRVRVREKVGRGIEDVKGLAWRVGGKLRSRM